MDNLIKKLILINGLLLPSILIIWGGIYIKDHFFKQDYQSDGYNSGTIVNNQIIDQKGDTITFQGLTFDMPVPIFDSSYFMIDVASTTYMEPLKGKAQMASGVLGTDLGIQGVNLLILDKNYNCIGKLLNKKNYLRSFRMNWRGAKNKAIAYLAVLRDSNKDGVLNSEDEDDFFVTKIPSFLTSQLSKYIEVLDYEFINENEIFIRYADRTNTPKEYRLAKSAIYDINTTEFRKIESINKSLEDIIKILNARN